MQKKIEQLIARDRATAYQKLLEQMEINSDKEDALVVYIWALGLTKEPRAVPKLISLHRKAASQKVILSTEKSIAAIGGNTAGEFLLSQLDGEAQELRKMHLLRLLSHMKYEKMLPRLTPLLEKKPRRGEYPDLLFIFANMGDSAVPFLKKLIAHKNRTTRSNVIQLLAQWLIPKGIASEFTARYWKESESEIRALLIIASTMTTEDFSKLKTFLELVKKKEKDSKVIVVAQESIKKVKNAQDMLRRFRESKKINKTAFDKEYAIAFNTAGKKGSLDVLTTASSVKDEAMLKALRERILVRDSDEALDDFLAINSIIYRNRISEGDLGLPEEKSPLP